MFAYLATRKPSYSVLYTNEVRDFAGQHGTSSSAVQTLKLRNFQLDFFDSGRELHYHIDDRYCALLAGAVLNKKSLGNELNLSTSNDAQFVLDLFLTDKVSLSRIDGHVSVMIFDSVTQSFYLVGDRFLRYSTVFSVDDPIQVSSHSALLYPFLRHKMIDMDALSQAVHFRWLTGHRRLFSGTAQVLAGSITHIDESGCVHREAYSKLEFNRETNVDVNYWIREVEYELDQTLSEIAKRHDVIGIPLSGGVDSSLLLAKAKQHFKKCFAVTARFQSGSNPELDNASSVAKHLDVRHVIVDVDDHFVQSTFAELVRLHEQPLRNYSDIALARVLQSISKEAGAFLYGEGADTLFGLGAVHRIARTREMAAIFSRLPAILQRLVSNVLPEKPSRMWRLKTFLADGEDPLVYSMERINFSTPPWQVFPCARKPSSDEILNEYLCHGGVDLIDRASVQLLATGVTNHIENTGRLASKVGVEMYVPFVLNGPRSVAVRLPAELQLEGGVYKKVLRELACRYVPREYIYARKFGFPTPEKDWLNGPLAERVRVSKEGAGYAARYYSADTLSSLSIERDYEHLWFAICLDELLSSVNSERPDVQGVARKIASDISYETAEAEA